MLRKLLSPFQDRRKVYELIVGLSLLLVMSCVASTRWLDPFELLFFDLRFKLRPNMPFPSAIHVVAIDESSLDIFGRWPWSRDKHAAVIGLLKHSSFLPAVISYDALFENKNPNAAKTDETLVYQTQNLKERIIMSYFFEKGPASMVEHDDEKEKRLEDFAISNIEEKPKELDKADKVSLPFLELARVSELAFVNTPLDPDGRTRYSQLIYEYRGKIYPSMDLLAALKYLKLTPRDIIIRKTQIILKTKSGDRIIPINSKGQMLINYYGGSEGVSSSSFVSLLSAGKEWMLGKKPAALKNLKDRIVLVGVSAQGIGDRRVTPFRQYEPGVFLHAQTIANIIENRFLVRASPWQSYSALLAVSIAAIFLAMFMTILRSLPLVVLLGVVHFAGAFIFFVHGVWIDVAMPLFTIAVIFVGITAFRYFTALQELKRTQDQLIQSAKMAALGQLSAGISHEFRNIMNAIYLNVQCLNQENLTEERMKKYIGMLVRILENANLILNGLLTFARKSESTKEPGNLKKTVEDTLLLVEKEMMRNQIDIESNLEEVPDTLFDAGQISQVVMNLMNNARDAFMNKQEGRLVKIDLINHQEKIQINIGDNGSGISPQVLKRLFEPFVTSKQAGKGTGLGLSVCHGIIRNHGGDIQVTTKQGVGTTWHIFLPKG